MVETLLIILGAALGIDLLVLLKGQIKEVHPSHILSDQPPVTLLIALRNEEKNLEDLVQNLLKLDYPGDKLQIIMGEDRSEDHTRELLNRLVEKDSRFTVIDIAGDIRPLKAKANVVAQLIPFANSEFLFIMDADVRVPPSWIHAMLQQVEPGVGVIGGYTLVIGKDIWSQLQNMDWLLAQAQLQSAASIYGALAVSGTNMMITKTACQAIGGYQKIPYSLTEDIGFLLAVTAKGFAAKHIFDRRALARVKPQSGWRPLFSQRRRWIYGATKMPGVIVLLLGIRACFLVVLLLLAFLEPWWALGMLVTRLLVQALVVNKISRRLGERLSPATLLIFEFYHSFLTIGSLVLYTLPFKFSWKGRTYK